MAAKFELKKTSDGEYVFNLKAGNGEVILTSESYKSKADAENGIRSVQENAAKADRFTRKTARNDQPFFVLTASNGQTIGKSEMYSSASAMENGIKSVMANAGKAAVADLTAS